MASMSSMSRDGEAREGDDARGRRRGDARSMGGRREARAKKAEEDQKLKMAAWDKVLQKRQQQKRLAAERF